MEKLNTIKRWNKNRIGYIHFSYNDFYDFDNFLIELLQVLQEGVQYSLLLRIRYNNDLYAMGGAQIGLKYRSDSDQILFESIHDVFKKKLGSLSDDYDIEELNAIQVLFVRVEDLPQFRISNLKSVNFKVFTNEKENKARFTLIPLTMDTNYFGKLLLKDREVYLDRINRQRAFLNEKDLDENIYSIYLYNDEYIILSIEYNGVVYRDIYDSRSGILVNKIQDRMVGDYLFIRKIGNNSLTIFKDRIVKIESERKLLPIKYKHKSLKDESNTLIGSWDVEAFNDKDGYAKVYALGFYVLGGKVKTYYLEKGMTPEELVIKCIDDMLSNEYKGYIFYTHNFGRYDSVFLLKILKEANIRKGYEYYKLNAIYRDEKCIKLTIKVKRSLSDRKTKKDTVRKDPGFNIITIVDSLNLLNQSLSSLCHSFNVEVTKGFFPHKFVNRNTINYVGNTPSFDNWDGIELLEYNKLVKPDWSLEDECIKYLEKDLISLTLIMNKFSEYINRKYHLQVTDSLTISRLALNIFLKDYLKDSQLPVIGRNMFSDVKKAYYGGVTEVYKPYGENLFYYDVNSLYPFAALNPMPGISCTFVENVDKGLDLKDLFGFFYCEVETGSNYLGLLPVHHTEGLIMPNGKWKGWYYSEELKYASEKGYKINVIKGYIFNKVENVFTEYVNNLYEIKSTTKDIVEKDINKRLLNHLLGRFGMNIVKPITELVGDDKLSLIMSTREVLGQPKMLTEKDYLVTYNPEIDPTICEQHGLDYTKVSSVNSNVDSEKLNEFNDVSLTTAAAVTAYARVYMSKIKSDILAKGGNIYYTDTDSIVTDIKLDDKLVGKELGQFKLEHKVKKGYFISNKTYCLQLFDEVYDKFTNKYTDFVIKSKSVISGSLTLNAFMSLYKGENIKATKRSAITNHNKGSVVIVDNSVSLNHDSYTKREKTFKRSQWVDTKPLILGEVSDIKKKEREKDNIIVKLLFKWKSLLTIILLLLNGLTFGVIYLLLNEDVAESLGFYGLDGGCVTDTDELYKLYLDEMFELQYLNDYMEEPIDIEIRQNVSYYSKFIKFFSGNEYNIYNSHVCFTDNLGQSISYKSLNNNSDIFVDSIIDSYRERPEVLTNLLRTCLNEAYKEINILNDRISTSELWRLRNNVVIQDTIQMLKKIKPGQSLSPFSATNSPVLDWANPLSHSSPIINRNSELLERNFANWSGSRIGNNSPSTGVNSPYLGNYSPNIASRTSFIRDLSPSVQSYSPSIKQGGLFIDTKSDIVRHGSPLAHSKSAMIDTPIEGLSSKSAMIDTPTQELSSKSAILDTTDNAINSNNLVLFEDRSRVIIKPSVRTIESPSLMKRFGHVWPDDISINDSQSIKRYGRIWHNGLSVLENYNPLEKRYGQIWEGGIPILKYYASTVKLNNSIEQTSSIVEQQNNISEWYDTNVD